VFVFLIEGDIVHSIRCCKNFKIKDAVLERIAKIVDEADTIQEVFLEPIAPGLDFICDGICLTSPDDITALERGSTIFDALYAQISAK
jgi:hypothetical protein